VVGTPVARISGYVLEEWLGRKLETGAIVSCGLWDLEVDMYCVDW
jgi:hypothetical protein